MKISNSNIFSKSLLVFIILILLPGIIFSNSKPERFQSPGLLSVNGYVHVLWYYDFYDYAYPKQSFVMRRGRLEFCYELVNAVAAEIEIGCDKLDLTIKDAFLEYQVNPNLRFAAGLKKMPFSYEEITPISKLLTIERTRTNKEFGDYNYLGQDIGLMVSGELFKHSLAFNYALGVFNGNGARVFSDNNNAKQFCERITFKPIQSIILGFNATQCNDSLTGDLLQAWGGDLVGRFGNLTIETEILFGNTLPTQNMLGVYLTTAYQLSKFILCLRIERFCSNLANHQNYSTFFVTGCNWLVHRKVQLKTNLITDILTDRHLEQKVLVQAQVGF